MKRGNLNACRGAVVLALAICVSLLPSVIRAQSVHPEYEAAAGATRDPDAARPVEAGDASASGNTDAERRAAFAPLGRMSDHMDDDPILAMLLVDRLEVRNAKEANPLLYDAKAWIGTDLNRLYLRSEGDMLRGVMQEATIEALWARPVSRWWNLAVGVRQDVRPRAARNWLALGVMGVAAYRVEMQVTAYLGDAGRTALRVESQYDLLLTQRLVLQPRLQLDAYGSEDRARGIGSGIERAELGLRLRYEFRREVAPYVGISWAGARTAMGAGPAQELRGVQGLIGIRVWH